MLVYGYSVKIRPKNNVPRKLGIGSPNKNNANVKNVQNNLSKFFQD